MRNQEGRSRRKSHHETIKEMWLIFWAGAVMISTKSGRSGPNIFPIFARAASLSKFFRTPPSKESVLETFTGTESISG